MEYSDLLDRAIDSLPELAEQDDRLELPEPEGETDGAFTRLTNLDAIASALSRDVDLMHRHIQREFGTNGQLEEGRARYNGSFSIEDFNAAIESFVTEYVRCSECGLPDTYLVTENGTQMLRCEACGAFRPVTKQTAPTQQSRAQLEEGKTYEVEITGTGRKGDGVAEKGKYTIFVSGAKEGQVVNAHIESISGTLAFARQA